MTSEANRRTVVAGGLAVAAAPLLPPVPAQAALRDFTSLGGVEVDGWITFGSIVMDESCNKTLATLIPGDCISDEAN